MAVARLVLTAETRLVTSDPVKAGSTFTQSMNARAVPAALQGRSRANIRKRLECRDHTVVQRVDARVADFVVAAPIVVPLTGPISRHKDDAVASDGDLLPPSARVACVGRAGHGGAWVTVPPGSIGIVMQVRRGPLRRVDDRHSARTWGLSSCVTEEKDLGSKCCQRKGQE